MEILEYRAIASIGGYLRFLSSRIDEDWGACCRVDHNYKQIVKQPYIRLMEIEDRLKVQCYSNGYYIGEVNSQNRRNGWGMYVWRQSENDPDFTIFAGYWQNNEKSGLGSYFYCEGEETDWYVACQEYSGQRNPVTKFRLSYRGISTSR